MYFLKDIERIEIIPRFTRAFNECKVNSSIPKYITELEFNKIMDSDWCLLYNKDRKWYKTVFQLYWDTGMRLKESFIGKINGNYLDIPKHLSKSRRERSISLSVEQVNVVKILQEKWINTRMSKDHIKNYLYLAMPPRRYCTISCTLA